MSIFYSVVKEQLSYSVYRDYKNISNQIKDLVIVYSYGQEQYNLIYRISEYIIFLLEVALCTNYSLLI